MKKTIFFVLLIFILSLPRQSFAVSGACSDHGGVNCSIGPGSLGNAVCNDGWQSSVSYYQTDECNAVSSCVMPTVQDCNAGGEAIAQNLYGEGTSIPGQGAVTGCQDAHIQYEAQLATYNACVSANAAALQQSIQDQAQLLAQSLQQSEDAVCQTAHGTYSQYDSTKNACACQSGYETDPINSQCELPATADADKAIACTNALGPNAYLRPFTTGLTTQTQCVCRDGFTAGASGQCVDTRPVRTITQQALDFAKTNQNCKTDSALSSTEIEQCFTYESNPDSISWQVITPQAVTPSPVPAPSVSVQTSVDQPNGVSDTVLQKVVKSLPVKIVVHPLPFASTAATTSVVATSSQDTSVAEAQAGVGSPIATPAPKQMHWYEWLNPVNWFSWFR